MLRDENKQLVQFDNHKYNDFLTAYSKEHDVSKEDLKRKIHHRIQKKYSGIFSKKEEVVKFETISDWSKFKRNGMPKGNPGKIEYVYEIADVLEIGYKELIKPYEHKNKVADEIRKEQMPIIEEKTDNNEVAQEDNIVVTNGLSADEAIDQINKTPLVRYFLEYILWYFFGVGLGIMEKYLLLKKKLENNYDIDDCLKEIGESLALPYQTKVFKKGNWFQAMSDKKFIRNKMSFYGIDWLFLITCLKYISRVDFSWYQVLGIFYGPRMLSDGALQSIMYLLNVVSLSKLQDALPVKDIDDSQYFTELSDKDVNDYIASAQTIILAEDYGKSRNVNDRYDVVERYLKNHNIKLPRFYTRTAGMSNLYNIKNSVLYKKKEEAVILYDNTYMGDEFLKKQIEAFAYERDVPIIYCRKK